MDKLTNAREEIQEEEKEEEEDIPKRRHEFKVVTMELWRGMGEGRVENCPQSCMPQEVRRSMDARMMQPAGHPKQYACKHDPILLFFPFLPRSGDPAETAAVS